MSAELDVLAAHPGCTIQDAGRPGRLSSGLPPSGPLDPTAHAAANLAAGNAPGAAAIEIPLGGLKVRARGRVTLSVDGEPARELADGDALEVEPSVRAVRYLAVRGAIDVPIVQGARATLLVAALGGLDGRALRPGDRLAVGEASGVASGTAGPTVVLPDDPAMLHVVPGPHLARLPSDALDVLLATTWSVSRLGDRVGVRLEGGRVPRAGGDLSAPVPMVRGVVQVVTDGTPIVLGPDHPVTGGYPVLAVLRVASQGVLARLRPGRRARFAI